MDTPFINFWQLYAPQYEFKNRYQACERVWKALEERNRRLIMHQLESEQAQRSPPPVHTKNPYFFLIDWHPPKPHWLTPAEVGQQLAQHLPLAVCRNPETGLFGTVTRAEAELYELEIHHYM